MDIRMIALCLLLSTSMVSQTSPPALVPSPQPAWTEHCRESTISLGRIVTDQGQEIYQVLGTAIIVATDEHHVYIVTAKHAFDDPSQGWHPAQLRVRFAWQENKSLTQEHGIAIDLIDQNGRNLWRASADGDLAALPLPDSFKNLPLHAIGVQDFPAVDDLYDGASVFVYGFPTAVNSLVGDQALVRAITRGGVIAWTDPSGPLDKPFLIDANILPGNSGGPVFKVPTGMSKQGSFNVGGKVAFLGIVTQDLTGWYTVMADGRIVQVRFPDLILPSTEQVQVTGIGGLGKVEPAARVRQLIESMVKPDVH